MTQAQATTTQAEEILASVEEAFGFRPNLIQEMVASPAVARVYLGGQEAMADASLSEAEKQAVQLAVAAYNDCHYCRAAHTKLGGGAGIDEEDVEAISEGRLPGDERLATLVEATRRVLEKRGWLDAEDVQELASRSVDRAGLYEIVALVGLKTISNYINHIAGTEVDPQFR